MAYLALARAALRASLAYRVSFVARAASAAVADLTPILLLGIVLTRFSSLAGWRWPELALLYGLSQTSYALARCFSVPFDDFDELIISGDFDIVLTRPLPPLLHVLAAGIEPMAATRVALGVAVLVAAFRAAGVAPTAEHLAVAAAAVAGGALILFALTVTVAALSFWVTRTGKLQDIVQNSSRAFAEYPLLIYPAGIRAALTYVLPLALVTYFPARRLLERPGSHGPLSLAAPIAGALLMGAALLLWGHGLRRYRSTGS